MDEDSHPKKKINANAGEQSPAFADSESFLERIANFTNLHKNIFGNPLNFEKKILNKNEEKCASRVKVELATQQCMRFKKSNLFEDSNEGRLKCFEEIYKKILQVQSAPLIPCGYKNLIYYTVFFDNGYVELLNKSILTILKYSKINFDILLITDQETKKKIQIQPFAKRIKPKYLILKTPLDGVEASECKTKIFEYVDINKYNKILFLDCDIICLKDINLIFNSQVEENTLYTARNLNLNYNHHKTIHHGFIYLNDEHISEMTQAKQMPFNAGQFLFKNSNKMKNHFDNVNWFMKNWTGEYFFEQAFMNYYFCKAKITNDTILQDRMSIVSTTNRMQYKITEDTCLVHFIAPPLDAKTKLTFIKNFQKDK